MKTEMSNVLFVEDCDSDFEMACEALVQVDAPVRALRASSGKEFLGLVSNSSEPIDLFVMDVVLPDSSGLDLAKALRGRMSSQKTPIVIFSSSTNPDHLEKAKACGVSEYRVKPMAPDEYLCAIRDIVHNWMPRRGGKAL